MQETTYQSHQNIILPADSAFIGGSKHLTDQVSTQNIPNQENNTTDSAVTDAASMLFIIICIAYIKKFVNLTPSLVSCVIRWKENINLEDSTKLCLTRDSIYLILLIPFCLISVSYRIYDPIFLNNLSETYYFLSVTGIFMTYLAIRMLMHRFIRIGKTSEKIMATASHSFRTYFIIMTTFILATAGVAAIADIDADVVKNILIYEILTFYTLFLLRKTQIFNNYCSLIPAILYLCALEFLPTGILVASALIF